MAAIGRKYRANPGIKQRIIFHNDDRCLNRIEAAASACQNLSARF